MATRSRIGYVQKNGKVKSIYCHWDGYPEHHGPILLDNYDYETAKELIALGDISSLDNCPSSTEAYHRDRGEVKNPARIDASADAFFNSDIEEYGYLIFPNGEWYIKAAYSFHSYELPLALYMSGADEECEDAEETFES